MTMSNFQTFSALVHARYNELAKHELFVVGDDNRAFEQHYLALFPTGTNPIYKVNTKHDCGCCKNFIRNLGNVVAIIDGKIETVWDVKGAPHPYDVVAKGMNDFVKGAHITDVFRTKESAYGAEQTKQLLEDNSAKRWNHFHGKVAARHFTQMAGTAQGDYRAAAQVFMRGLAELKAEAFDTVLSLIDGKSLYRGEEHLHSIKAFQKLQQQYKKLSVKDSEIFIWANAMQPGARFRNTVIGTLLVDLSEGVDLEQAVRSFESKVAPTNYKRPTALITPRMVQDAMAKIKELDLEAALERRFAKISDVSVNNVLWVDNSAKGKMKGGIEDVLMAAASKPVKVSGAQDISIDDFMSKILPTATGMGLLVKNSHMPNFVSLTAPVHADSGKLFKWANDFAWAYSGNIADSELRRAVAGRGGRVDGVFRFSHTWNYGKRNASLMDLHVFMPGSTKKADAVINDYYGNGQRVGWNQRNDAASGGRQDVDYTAAAPAGYVPVENITFPDLSRMPEGDYVCMVHNWNLRAPTEGGFRAEIEFGGQLYQYEVDRPLKNKEWVPVATVSLRAGQFTISHHLPHQATTQDMWGIKTETFVKVDTLMHSPNYWDDNAVGNKHWFFILNGCKSEDTTRGIFNEFLRADLEPHRKVFEVLGDKTKCQPADEQLSGLGFSSTRGDTVTVQVATATATKTFNVTF